MSLTNFSALIYTYIKIKHSDWLKESPDFDHPIRELYFSSLAMLKFANDIRSKTRAFSSTRPKVRGKKFYNHLS